jgi:hypothetical protein
MGFLTSEQPYGSPRPVTGTALPFFFIVQRSGVSYLEYSVLDLKAFRRVVLWTLRLRSVGERHCSRGVRWTDHRSNFKDLNFTFCVTLSMLVRRVYSLLNWPSLVTSS